ncbi:4-coumarate--CoA ligase 1-like [Tribolium madens]|uniref:4-coumarate--CoA ligase 1-like n=1 Tax=Tribolium madens TaxID=41895 RepID=UPI001CF75431|nr:4-coumarate--CoA ligase 1-like [Tribolium madens]
MVPKILEGEKVNTVPNVSLGQFIFDSATKFGEKACQIDSHTNTPESFLSVKQRSVRVAMEMQKRGITSQDTLVFCSKVTLDTPIPIIASFFLGAKIANLDPTLSTRQTSHLLSIISPKMIFVSEAALNLIEESLESANLKTAIVVYDNSTKYPTFSEFVKRKANEENFKPVDITNLDETIVMFFSSGTTGLPKAICHSHSSFLHLVYNFYETNGKGCFEVILSFTTFYWLSGMLYLTCTFVEGGHRVICRDVEDEQLFQLIEKYKVTFIFVAPILTYRFTNCPNFNKYDTSSLRSLVISGTPISTIQLDKVRSVFKHTNVILAYGQTEIGYVSMYNTDTDSKFIQNKYISCGKVVKGVTLKVVDVETNEILGPNKKGEIYAKTKSLMKGYYNSDNKNIFEEDGFLRTGDIGYYDEDECLYYVERIKEMFKYLSWHIVPSAIELVLMEHPAIKEVVVFGFPRSEEEGEVPTACVVLKDGPTASGKEIEDFVASRVSDKEKLRGGVYFMNELPRTPSGKLKRKEIRDYIIKELKKN